MSKNQSKTSTTTPATPKVKKEKVPCACSLARVIFIGKIDRADLPKGWRDNVDYDADHGVTYVETYCQEKTNKIFAPGHDARFKSLMQIAFRAKVDAEYIDGAMLVSSDAVGITERVAPKLVPFVTAPVAAPKPRSRKAKAKAAKDAAPVVIRAKVGRWEYEGTIDKTTGNFIYTDAKGKVVMASNFTEIA
jgi:hypothetical protein